MRVATVFSGIGAIEQALKRLEIDHEIVFACDNGNVDLDFDYEEELKKVKKLKTIQEKKEYVDQLTANSTRRTNFVKKSYLANYTIQNNLFFENIKLLDGNDFKGEVDLYVGGSPCQSFSMIGERGGLEDTRGTLFYDYVRVLREVQPKAFIFENVYGLLNHDKGNTWKIMKDVFDDSGYYYKYEVLDAKDFGIPQSRRRIFVVGFKDKHKLESFNFPKAIDLEFTMQDFLIDNLKDGYLISKNGKLKRLKNEGQEVNEKLFLSDKLKKYVLSPGTKNFMHKNAKIDLPIARALLSTMGNTHRSSVNNYVTTNGKIRALDPRETHRLMGFPDDYKIVVSRSQAYKQSGNSIVVDVLIHLMEEMIKVL